MSLSLLQGYSSAEEDEQHKFAEEDEENEEREDRNIDIGDSDDDIHKQQHRMPTTYNPIAAPSSAAGSALPSALDAFSEIAGPPKFLNNCVEDEERGSVEQYHHGRRRRKRNTDYKDLPPGAVMEAKAQLVGIHERVRSDIEGGTSDKDSQLRMCLQCGIPKTYTSARGMVCPVCSDRPSDDGKKGGSTIKDKEKIKRMRGQSSHATWKSETEMHLRQQFD